MRSLLSKCENGRTRVIAHNHFVSGRVGERERECFMVTVFSVLKSDFQTRRHTQTRRSRLTFVEILCF